MGVLLVCGGRRYSDITFAFDALDRMAARMTITAVRHGAARGADAIANAWARDRGYTIERFPADWTRGRSAGPERNHRMIMAKPHPVACVAFAGGGGTAGTVRLCRLHEIPVWHPDVQPVPPWETYAARTTALEGT
jgi:hypothetical protein